MRFDELVRLKALQLKAVNTGQTTMDLVDSQLQLPDVAGDLKMKNVCAMVSPQLFTELEGTCELLGISKRKFIEGALIEALNKAAAIVSEVEPFAETH